MKATATAIVRRLRDAGRVAYFAGGSVRDLVRGVEPHDIDIATSATPGQVQVLFPKTVPVGAQFGVVLVLENGHQFEVATFRSDEAYSDGRRPDVVRFGSPEADALRRDFTINGLFYDPISEEIIDFVGGRADIERRIVRTIGEPRQRFGEDKLRLLRCIRFASNLGFEIEENTFAAVNEMATQITDVSAERIREELTKIFTRARAGRGLELLDTSGLLQEILPEVAAMKGVEQPSEFHPEGDVFAHTKLMLDTLPPNPSVVLTFAVLLHDVGKPPTFVRATDRIRFNEHDRVGAEMTEKILRRLRFPNEQIEKIVVCVAEHMRFQHVQQMRPAKLKRILARETFPDELELHRLDCESSHRNLENYQFLKAKAVELPPGVVKPRPLLTGHDLLALGLKPGPKVGQILREAEELQLEERLKSKAEALAFAQRRLAELGRDATT
ncbi:MAG TPA: CCA tRNA nucleotidyltransferase [Verrucomicrobiae bacterium]|nr:CCA tRNA nucleotidyltransferase [Verrucomicrobiae bacterium]